MAGQNESTETSLISMPFFTEIGSETKFFSFGGLQESPFYAIISKIFWYRHSAQGRKYHGTIISLLIRRDRAFPSDARVPRRSP